MVDAESDVNELWNELIDIIQELKSDVKDSRRAKRHLKSLEQTVSEIGIFLNKVASKKKGIFK